MKRMKRLFKMNNRGLSLVELICTVAILGLATTAVGGAMVVSAQQYQRGSGEFAVQQEAQLAANLIGDLVVDAAFASFEDSTDTLTITRDGATHTIKKVGSQLQYTEAGGTSGVLAEGVTDFFVDANSAEFETDKSVAIKLNVKKDDKEYEASYNSTARNGNLSSASDSAVLAVFSMDSEVVIEPNQSYVLPVNILGMTNAQVNGFVLDKSDVPGGWSVDLNATQTAIEIQAPIDADGSFMLTINTNKVDGSGNPLATKDVMVKVRRVEAIALTRTSGSDYVAGSEYTYTAVVNGDNLDRGFGKNYDLDSYEYKNPYYIDFGLTFVNWDSSKVEIVSNEDCNTPNLKIKFKEDMPTGAKIVVTATAKHPEGKWNDGAGDVATNKSGVSYANKTATDEIKNGDSWSGVNGLKRGDKQYWVYNTGNTESYYISTYGVNNFRKYIRFWVDGTPEPAYNAGWMEIVTTGTLDIQLQEKESTLFDLDKTYIVELMLNVTGSDPADVRYPEAGITPREEYITRFEVPGGTIKFKNNSHSFDGYDNYGMYIGTKDQPIEMNVLTEYVFDILTERINYKTTYSWFEYKLQKETAPGVWQDSTDLEITNVFVDCTEEDKGLLKIKGQDNSNVRGSSYRILTICNYKKAGYDAVNKKIVEGSVPESVELYDESTGRGIFYIKFND